MRRLYDDASTVKRKKGQSKKKKVGETDAKLTISNISYQKEKELIDDRLCMKCVTAAAFGIGQFIYIYT